MTDTDTTQPATLPDDASQPETAQPDSTPRDSAPPAAPSDAPSAAPLFATLQRTPTGFAYRADPNHLRDLLQRARALRRQEEAAAAAPVLGMQAASDFAAQPVEWLWPQRIALGKLTLIAGVPGLGKSQIAAFLAACVTNNRALPCGEGQAPQGSVVILSAEDDAADTIRPRLDAAGADASVVFVASSVCRRDGGGRRAFSLQADLALLESRIKELDDVRLIVIDPISSYLGRVDSHKNAEVRTVLEPLADLAARYRVAVCAITHFSKGTAMRAMDRVAGSIAFVAAARTAFMIARDPADTDRRLLVTLKSNVAEEAAGLAFRIRGALTGNVPTSVIEWEEGKVEGSADEILRAITQADATKTARSEAEEFLRKLLGSGEVAVNDVRIAATAAGISWAALRRTQKAIGVRAQRHSQGNVGAGRWVWALPSEGSQGAQDAQGAHV